MTDHSVENDRPWPVIFGKEMRGGLRGGHCHMAYVSTPSLKGPWTRIDCPACVEWAEELQHNDGLGRPE